MGVENDGLFDDLKQSADRILGEGMLNTLVNNSRGVLGEVYDKLLSEDVPVSEKYKIIQEIELIAVSERVKAFNYETTNELAIRASSDLLAVIRTVKSTIKDKHHIETIEVVDFSNPKINRGFGFLIELVIKVLSEQEGISEEVLVRVIESLSTVTVDLEEKLNEAFYGVPISKIDEVKNPLITEQKATEMDYIPLFDTEPEEDKKEDTTEKKKLRKRRVRKSRRRKKKNGEKSETR